jgi:hypothetical protein
LAISNQGESAFNANFQTFLAKFEPKVFLRFEAFGESSKSVGLFLLREEVGKKLRQTYSGIGKAFARFVPMDLKERKRVEKTITFRIV